MFDWLFEGRTAVYIFLGVVAVFLLILWKQTPKDGFLVGAIACLGVIVLYWLLDRLVTTTREEVVGTVRLMADSVAQRNLDQAWAHFSDSFTTPQGKTKAEFRQLADNEMRSGRVTGVTVWEFQTPATVERPGPVTVSFLFKVRGDLYGKEDMFYRCEAVMKYEPPHGWRMQSCRIFDPVRVDGEVQVPF